jgi:hypothetical protein
MKLDAEMLKVLAKQYGFELDKVLEFLDRAAYHKLLIYWDPNSERIDGVQSVCINGDALQLNLEEVEECACGECDAPSGPKTDEEDVCDCGDDECGLCGGADIPDDPKDLN